jgi:hypothetical protein
MATGGEDNEVIGNTSAFLDLSILFIDIKVSDFMMCVRGVLWNYWLVNIKVSAILMCCEWVSVVLLMTAAVFLQCSMMLSPYRL